MEKIGELYGSVKRNSTSETFTINRKSNRVRAAGWVKKIREDEAGNDRLKTDYIKLLLFALQRKKLVGIFADDPDNYEKLEEFPPDFDLNSMARTLIQKEQSERIDRIRRQLRGQTGDYPPYTTDCSSDFREYAAAQDIPGFGVHCYYAFSKEPINLWQRADKGIYPKITKSAVDATSPLPPGVSGRSSDPSCVCPSAPGEVDTSCTARAHKPKESKKKRQKKKLGKSPPTIPLGTAPSPEERVPPTWSSNLMEVRDSETGEEREGAKSARSTVAIPKIRTEAQKRKKGGPRDDSDVEDAELKEMEDALEDFRRGEIKTRRRRGRRKRGEPSEEVSDEKLPTDELKATEYADDSFEDLDQSKFQEELEEDSVILEQFKDKLSQAETRRKLTERRKQVGSAAPAEVGIPLTTPRPSPSPKRQESSEKLYSTEEPEKKQADEVQPSLAPPKPKKRQISRLKAPKVSKLFEEASAMPDDTGKAEKEIIKDVQRVAEISQLPAEADKKTPTFEGKSMTPIRKGSPQANAVFFDALETMENAGTGTPPIFSRDPKIREQAQMREYEDHLYEDVDEWTSGPEYFADKHDFIPYDPREAGRQLGQMVGQMDDSGEHLFDEQAIEFPPSPEPLTEDRYGLPLPVQVSKLPPPPPPKPIQTPYRFTQPRRPLDADLFDISEGEMSLVSADVTPTTPIYSDSPGVAGYVTPEHLKLPRRETPPAYVPTAFRPIPSPEERMSPPYRTDDEFFFDLSHESPPPQWESPPGAPGVNMLTVEEMTHGAGGIVSGLPSENVFGVKAVQEKYIDFLFEEDDKMKDLMKEVSRIDTGDDLFGETMPDLPDVGEAAAVSATQIPSTSGRVPMFPEFEEPYVTGRQRMEARMKARRDTPYPEYQLSTEPAQEQPMTGAQRFAARMAARRTPAPSPEFAPPRAVTPPARPPGPMYFPPHIQADVQYPQLSPGLPEALEDFEYDEEFLDPSRRGILSRFLIVGKTSTRMKDSFKKFVPAEENIITEDSNEPLMSPRGYGVPETPQRPPPVRTPPAPCQRIPTPRSRSPPRSPARPPSPEGLFDRPYIPPMYVSPGAGIMDESPPIIREDEHEIRRDLVDVTKDPLALTLQESMRRGRMKTAGALADLERMLGKTPPRRIDRRQLTPTPPRIPQEQVVPRQTPERGTPPQPMAGTPCKERKRVPPRRDQIGGRRPRPSRLTEGAMGRRIDFDSQDPGVLTETDKYIAEVTARRNLPPLSPPERLPPGPTSIMDEWVPGNLQSPLQPPTVLPGWKTPPRFIEKPKTPPPFRAELPPVHQDHWFFDLPDETQFAPSPEQLPEYIDYDFATPQFPGDESFFGDEGPPSLASSAGLSPAICESAVCSGSAQPMSPMISPQRPTMTPRMHETPPRAESPRREETPQREVTPRRTSPVQDRSRFTPSPMSSSLSPVTTPLRDFDLDFYTPPSGAGERTPITKADRIFREAGIIDSPIEIVDIPPTPPPPPTPHSPLSDPAAMQQMMERVRGSEGRRGIQRMMTGEAAQAEAVQQPPRPADGRMSELRSAIEKRRKDDRRRDLKYERQEERERRGKPSMPRIKEYVSPVPYTDPHGLPPVQRVAGPSIWSDVYVTPRKARAPRRKVDRQDEMQRVIDDIVAGRLAHLDAIEVDEGVSPVSSPAPQLDLDFATPEHLKVKAMSPIRRMEPAFTVPGLTKEQLVRTPPAHLWDRTVAETGGDFGDEIMEFPPSPGQMSPDRTPPRGPPGRMGTLSPRQLFPMGPSPQETPRRTPPQESPRRIVCGGSPPTTPQGMLFDESFSEGLMSPGARAPESQDRTVTHRASQRRIITTMLPRPNITPQSPDSWNLSDSYMTEEDSNFKWMD